MSLMKSGMPVETGVEGKIFTPDAQWVQTLEAVRMRERHLRGLLSPEDCLEPLRSLVPAKAGEAARDLRERERVLRCLREKTPLPRTAEDLFRLWAAATAGDAFPCGRPEARFRREGEHIPFSGGSGKVRPGWETVSPGDIPRETGNLLRFIHSDWPCEIRAVSAFYLFGRIHPFRDGNGRTLRMLYCMLLSASCSVPAVLASLAGLQANRELIAEAEGRLTRGQADLSGFGSLLLRILGIAQYKLEIILQDRI